MRGAQQIYDKQGGIEALTELSKAKEKLAKRQSAMRTFIEESNAKCKKGTSVLTRHPNREWAGDMPKIASVNEKPFKPIARKNIKETTVNRKKLNGNSYRNKIHSLGIPKKAAEGVYLQAIRILQDRDGTSSERMSVVSWNSGKLVTDTFLHPLSNERCGLVGQQMEKCQSMKGGVITIHNHPYSSKPSWADINTIATNDCFKSSIIACHDGTIYELRCDNIEVVEAYNKIYEKQKELNPTCNKATEIEVLATESLYKANEVKKWFRLIRKT